LIAVFWVLVFVASFIDLRTGIAASKAKGEFKTTSSGLRQTLRKDMEYMAMMFIAFLLDFSLSYLTSISDLVGLFGLFKVPLCSLGMLIFILVTEYISVKENIEKKKGSPIIPKKTVDLVSDLIGAYGEEKLTEALKFLKK